MIPPALLAHRHYMRLWSARLASVGASQMMMVAIGWLMYDLTGSAWDLGLVGLLQFLPSFALTLVAGHVADRYHRARILTACLAVQTLVALVLAVAPLTGWNLRTLLLALSVVLGAVKAFQMTAQQALVPLLVPAELLPRALAFSSTGLQAAVIGGPALGGLLYVAGSGAVFGTAAALFAAATALCAAIRHPDPAPGEPASLASVFAGVRYVWGNKVVLGAISLDLFAVLLGGATALLPIYAKDILQVGPWGLGLLRGAPAVGALGMSLVLTRWPIARRAGRWLLVAVAVYGAAIVVFGLSTHALLSWTALCITGAADMVSVVVRHTLVQLETPDTMRGRVSAVNSLFIGASGQLGEFESGATAAWLGPVGSVLLGGLGAIAVAGLWVKLFPALAQRDTLVRPMPG